MTADSARALLRRETSDLHAELDELFADTDFDSRPSYARLIARQAAPLLAVEGALDGGTVPAQLTNWAVRRRSRAMVADLRALDLPVPQVAPLRAFKDADAELGALYVLEGSRLGAAFLLRQARASRDPTVRAATAFLAHGEGARFWPTFLEFMSKRERAGLNRAALVAGAREAFAAFLAAARQTIPEPV